MITEIGNKQLLLSFSEKISETTPIVVRIPDAEKRELLSLPSQEKVNEWLGKFYKK